MGFTGVATAGRPSFSKPVAVSPHASAVYTERLRTLSAAYNGDVIDVKVRHLVGPLPADELTHGVFPYPARLLRHVPRLILGAQHIMEDVDFVVDPFCGSGTILLEAQRYGHDSYGFDQNPVAALISRVKTSPRRPRNLHRVLEAVVSTAKRTRRHGDIPEYLVRWYSPAALSVMERLVIAKNDYAASSGAADFIDLVVALAARRLSLADPSIPVPVRARRPIELNPDALWPLVNQIGRNLIQKIERLQFGQANATVRWMDSRDEETWAQLPKGSRGLLFTSPPYGASQKYIRSCSLEAGWLGFSGSRGTINLERDNIGRENIPLADVIQATPIPFSRKLAADLRKIRDVDYRRYRIYLSYFTDMAIVFSRMASCSQIAAAVIVAGDNIVCGRSVPTNIHLKDLIMSAGFHETLALRDPIGGRTLITRRHNGHQPTESEFVRIFER